MARDEVDSHWKREPEDHDFPAAADYLSLLMPPRRAKRVVETLREASTELHKAKDLLRASGLPLLASENVFVARDMKKVVAGEKLSPVLLVRGSYAAGRHLLIADGYHRVCASYHLDENAEIPCRIVDARPKPRQQDKN
jgi:hypothetical protein